MYSELERTRVCYSNTYSGATERRWSRRTQRTAELGQGAGRLARTRIGLISEHLIDQSILIVK